MPTTLMSLRINSELLEYLKERAEQEHRSLSNMIVSILNDSKKSPACYFIEDIEMCFAKIGAFLAAHANDDKTREIYWRFSETHQACYPIIHPKDEQEDGKLNGRKVKWDD